MHITNKTKYLSFKSGCTVQVVKLIKEDWPKESHKQALEYKGNLDRMVKFICIGVLES